MEWDITGIYESDIRRLFLYYVVNKSKSFSNPSLKS